MKLSVSNIGWTQEQDLEIYRCMKSCGFCGLEIAPTRIFPDAPYDHIEEARLWANTLKKDWGFGVSSMQSIWYGRSENMFGSEEEYRILKDYTKKAILFSEAAGCGNLVFGCPRNRNLENSSHTDRALEFFHELGEYALVHSTVIGMEANPPIYHTNFINDTASALSLIEAVDSRGFRLNLDLGTMIENQEEASLLAGRISLINHVHISEPSLRPICRRPLHRQIRDLLLEEGYSRFVSIEMGKTDDLKPLQQAISYTAEFWNP